MSVWAIQWSCQANVGKCDPQGAFGFASLARDFDLLVFNVDSG